MGIKDCTNVCFRTTVLFKLTRLTRPLRPNSLLDTGTLPPTVAALSITVHIRKNIYKRSINKLIKKENASQLGNIILNR